MSLYRPKPTAEQRNLRLVISYDGSAFSGFQWQPHVYTVQQALMEAWKVLTGEENISLFGCSRLDAGVNANHFVLNIYTSTNLDEEKILRALNGIFQHQVQKPIFVFAAEFCDAQFHARYDSKGKHYRYQVWYGFETHRSIQDCWIFKAPNAPLRIHETAQKFVGKHDFAGFRAQDCGATNTMKTILKCDVWKTKAMPQKITIDIWGDGFLKNMIRNLVGTLIEECSGKLAGGTIENVLKSGDRKHAGTCAPGHALSLEQVYYSEISSKDYLEKKPGTAVQA